MSIIKTLWHILVQPSPQIHEPALRRRSQLLASLIVAIIPLGSLVALTPFILGKKPTLLYVDHLFNVAAICFLIIAYVLNRRGHFWHAAWFALISMCVVVLVSSLLDIEHESLGLLIYLAMPILFSSMLLSIRFTMFLSAFFVALMILIALIVDPVYIDQIPVIYMAMVALMVILIVRHRDRVEEDRRETLEASEERFRSIFTHAPIGMAVLDRLQRFIRVNEQMSLLLGYSATEFSTLSLKQILHPEDSHYQYFEIPQTMHQNESRCVTRDGNFIWASITLEEINNPIINGALLMLEDVTQRRHMQEQAQNTELMALELQKQRELGEFKSQFISAVSHEFRTPLAAILASTSMLQRYYDRIEPEKRGDYLERIKAQVSYMTEMVDNLTEISRNDAGQIKLNPEPINLQAFCKTLIDELRFELEKRHAFNFVVEGNFENLLIDTYLLRHILINLLTNAIKYTPHGGRITFQLTHNEPDVQFDVIDEGIGISPENQARLFEPFYRGKNVGQIKGTGLGLAIASDYVVMHGGSLQVQSEMGKGTRFTVKLPLRAVPVSIDY